MKRKINAPEWVNSQSIYEVNIRQYTKEGTFREFEQHLPRLKELGTGVLWFMPVFPIGLKNRKGHLGSYYSIRDYTAINPEFGTMGEFKALVEKIHKLGMKILIDWVANHTAWDHHWAKEHPEFYTKDESGNFKAPFPEWEDVIHLDYSNPDLWDEMINQMAFWLRETNIDGFRCDMAHLVPTLFWNRARRDLDRIKPVYMLAESENHDLLEYAFDTIYNWKLLHAMNDMAAGKINANELMDIAINENKNLPDGGSQLSFTSNHDENSWNGSAIERIHYYLEPLTILTFLLPDNTLIYSGQEAGNYKRLKFFDKDEINWKEDKMFALFQKLVHLKKTNPALSSKGNMALIENDANEKVVTLEIKMGDDIVIVFLNLSDQSSGFYIECKHYDGNWKNVFTGETETINCKKQFWLEPFKYLLLEKI